MFEIIKAYQGKKFAEVENTVRKALFKQMEKNTYHIENSDFLSMDKADLRFDFVEEQPNKKCDLAMRVMRDGKVTYKFDMTQDTELQKLSDNSFMVKNRIKVINDAVDDTKYSMLMTIIESEGDPYCVFSFSFSLSKDRADYNQARKVFSYHNGSSRTGSSGRG
jgi:hypothetical protein